MESTRKYVIEEIKAENLQSEIDVEMDVIGYEPIEEDGTDEMIIESEDLKGDIHDCSGLNSYCCQEYFDGFDTLLHHMEENHFGTLRKSLGARKDVNTKVH